MLFKRLRTDWEHIENIEKIEKSLSVFSEDSVKGVEKGPLVEGVGAKEIFIIINKGGKDTFEEVVKVSEVFEVYENKVLKVIEFFKNIFDDLGIPQLVKIKMDTYFDEAFRLLKTIDCDKEGLDIFNNFAKSLIKREG